MRAGTLIVGVAVVITMVVGVAVNGYGYSSRDNELTGQVKKVTGVTPILCPTRVDAHVSLGIMRGGVGSVSSEDVDLVIENKESAQVLRRAAETGKLVKITYNVERIRICGPDHIVVSVAMIDDIGKPEVGARPDH